MLPTCCSYSPDPLFSPSQPQYIVNVNSCCTKLCKPHFFTQFIYKGALTRKINIRQLSPGHLAGEEMIIVTFPMEFKRCMVQLFISHVRIACDISLQALAVSFVSLSLNDVTQLQTPLRKTEISFQSLEATWSQNLINIELTG